MKNYDIAVKWAEDTAKNTAGIMVSDKFFQPFGGSETARSKRLIRELFAKDVLVFPDASINAQGAYIIHKSNPRIHFHIQNGIYAGIYKHDENIMVLPMMNTKGEMVLC